MDVRRDDSWIDKIITDHACEIESISSILRCEIFLIKIFYEFTPDCIRIFLNMWSDICSDFGFLRREIIHSLEDDMSSSSSPATMDHSTFTHAHEDDNRTIGCEAPDPYILYSSIDPITVSERFNSIFSGDRMDPSSVNLRIWSMDQRCETHITKVSIWYLRKSDLKSTICIDSDHARGCRRRIYRFRYLTRLDQVRLHHTHRPQEHGALVGWW